MKARIVTFNRAYNYGAVLQCYALAQALIKKSVNCDVLDYFPKKFKRLYCNVGQPNTLAGYIYIKLYNFIKNIRFDDYLKYKQDKKKLKSILNARNKNFESFINKSIPLTNKTFYSQKDIKSISSDVDCYIAGSDQIWHNEHCDFDSVFFLDFPDADNKKKYSYAASFGMNSLPQELTEEYKQRLKNFDMFSVREKSGVDILNNLLNKNALISCDPTLLLTSNEWSNLCDDANVEEEPYILVYYVQKFDKLHQKAKELSEKTGYKVIAIPCIMFPNMLLGDFDLSYGFESKPQIGPDEFLTLFKNAKYVLSASFHGTVFSVLFHKQFLTAYENYDGKQNIRVLDLLESLGIENRDFLKDDIDSEINWNNMENNLVKLRNEGLEYIDEMIDNCECL